MRERDYKKQIARDKSICINIEKKDRFLGLKKGINILEEREQRDTNWK